MRFLFLLFTLLITSHLYADEVCLVGDQNIAYKFSQVQPAGVPLLYETFQTPNSACAALLQKMSQSSFWERGFISKLTTTADITVCTLDMTRSESPFDVHQFISTIEKSSTSKDCTCSDPQQTRNFYGQCVNRCPSGSTLMNDRCVLTSCPVGQELVGTNCVDKNEPIYCPVGYYLDDNNKCIEYKEPVSCSPDQILSDGVCIDKEPDDVPVCDPSSPWNFLCKWHQDFKDFVQSFYSEIDDLNETSLDIYNQNEQFYADVRLFLENYKSGSIVTSPTIIFPDLPEFCDYSVTMCDWYIDWQDWRNDYNKNELLAQEQRQKTIENQEKQLDEDKSFYDDARDFFDFIKETKEEETPTQPEQPTQPEEPAPPEPDDQQRVSWSATCPITQPSQSITLDGQTTTIQGFDMSEACSMAAKMRPLILLAGALISLLIIARGHS